MQKTKHKKTNLIKKITNLFFKKNIKQNSKFDVKSKLKNSKILKTENNEYNKTKRLLGHLGKNRFLQKFKEKISFLYLIKRHIKRRKNVDKISIEEISTIAQGKAIPLLICILTFPTALPIPYPPGFVSIVGAIGVILSFQMFLGYKKPVLPRFIMLFSIKKSFLIFIVEKFQLLIFKSGHLNLIKERMTFLATNQIMIQFIGIWICIISLFLFLPIPLTNIPLAISIVVICLGIIMQDGLLILLSTIPGIIGIIMCVSAFAIIKIAFFQTMSFFKTSSVMSWMVNYLRM